MTGVAAMSRIERVEAAIRRSLPLLPGEARGTVEAMLTPTALTIMVATIAVWGGSHIFGVGEVVDIILAVVGAFTLGWAAFDGAGALASFAAEALGARSDADLDQAAAYFARAVTILGVATVQAVLLRGQVRGLRARGQPRAYPRIQVGDPPPPGTPALRVSRINKLRSLGVTGDYGAIVVSRVQSISEQRITLYHELVHRFFSARTGPFRKFRAEVAIGGYSRVALLRYLEEVLAEGYAQLKVNGFQAALKARSFPIEGGYITVADAKLEGAMIGSITLAGAHYYVMITKKPVRPPAALTGQSHHSGSLPSFTRPVVGTGLHQ